MRLICFWCVLMGAAVKAQNDAYYAPQTFKRVFEGICTTDVAVKILRTDLSETYGAWKQVSTQLFKPDNIWNSKPSERKRLQTEIKVPEQQEECNCNVEWGIDKPCLRKKEKDSSSSVVGKLDEVTQKIDKLPGQNFPQRDLFSPARNDISSQSTTVTEPWRHPAPVNEGWRDHNSGPGNLIPKSEPWRLPYGISKEQQAAIIHHKQSLTSDGAFRFEYASDNGLAAGEQIEPDGSRVGAYQYKDPSGQVVKLKYRAGKDGFQILEGSHLPKSPEPVAPVKPNDYHNVQAYTQQRNQYELQQQYNQQKPVGQVQTWGHNQGSENNQRPPGNQYFINNWRPERGQDDGQYRDNEVDPNKPHNFGEGYAFAFKG